MMRLNYLNNGGHDQSILHRFTEMEYNVRFKDPTRSRNLNSLSNFGSYSNLNTLNLCKYATYLLFVLLYFFTSAVLLIIILLFLYLIHLSFII